MKKIVTEHQTMTEFGPLTESRTVTYEYGTDINFEDWFKDNYKEEYIEDGDWVRFSLGKKEIAGTSPETADRLDMHEAIRQSCEIAWKAKE